MDDDMMGLGKALVLANVEESFKYNSHVIYVAMSIELGNQDTSQNTHIPQ